MIMSKRYEGGDWLICNKKREKNYGGKLLCNFRCGRGDQVCGLSVGAAGVWRACTGVGMMNERKDEVRGNFDGVPSQNRAEPIGKTQEKERLEYTGKKLKEGKIKEKINSSLGGQMEIQDNKR